MVRAWEEGTAAPTFAQLEKLAARYRRPVALFFFLEPPAEPSAKESFRTLPEVEVADLEPDTLLAIREARGMQLALAELTGGMNPAPVSLLDRLNTAARPDVDALAAAVRRELSIGLEQQLSFGSAEEGFKVWRNAIEHAGIFVFKRSFAQQGVSGFCLDGGRFPVIYVNNSNTFSRQQFTLFHELGHLLYGRTGITKDDDEFLEGMDARDLAIEIACNRFAAELLVPSVDFDKEFRHRGVDDEVIRAAADRYRVSREVILRRLRDLGRISTPEYERRASELNAAFRRSKPASSGGNYYNTKVTYLGRNFLRLAFTSHAAGRCSDVELAGALGVKVKQLPALEAATFGPKG